MDEFSKRMILQADDKCWNVQCLLSHIHGEDALKVKKARDLAHELATEINRLRNEYQVHEPEKQHWHE